jgi:hypothetical protein
MVSWGESSCLHTGCAFFRLLPMFRPPPTGERVAPRATVRSPLRLLLLALLALVPAPASAVTVEQVVSLSKAGVSEAVILALIERDRTVFTIEPAQIVSLQQDGLSEPIILAMLKSGRQEGEEAARAQATATSAALTADVESFPSVAFVGHGPDRPNTTHVNGFYSSPPIADIGWYPYGRPYSLPLLPAYGGHRFNNQLLCLAQTTPAGGSASLAFVTACPGATSSNRRRFAR